MTDTTAQSGPVLAADGTPLKVSLARALRRQKMRALMLIAPLLLFILLTFLAPIADMLFRSVENGIVPETLPQTVIELKDWDPASGEAPGEAVFAALAADLKVAVDEKTHTRLGSRLNYESSGISSLFRTTGRKVKRLEDGNYREQFLEIDKGWGDVEVWRTIKRFSGNYTPGYFLNSVDAERGPDGLQMKPEDERIYLYLFWRTILLSVMITSTCLLFGYPIAWLLANLPLRTSNLLMILVLLPFWTSLLVRTTSWIVVLGQNGVFLEFLAFLNLVGEVDRPRLIYNLTGTIVAMTHILLPFMILPLYSVMRGISPSYMRAAQNLGATPARAFIKVYMPQTVPGLGAGCILVFILAIGYYITPALVGGEDGTMISNFIAHHMQRSLNWGLAAALGAMLLAGVMALYWVYDRIVGINNMKLG
jgi:putative spermidine/putrescine transport system permease protein